MDIIIRKNRQGRLGRIVTQIDKRLRYQPVPETAHTAGAPF